MKYEYVPDYKLERYILNELPKKEIRKIDELSKMDPELGNRIRDIKASNAGILEKYPPVEITDKIMRRYRASMTGTKHTASVFIFKRFAVPSAAFAGAALIIIIAFPLVKNVLYPPNIDMTGIDRPKGNESALYIYRGKNSGIENLHDGSYAKKGDLLQIAYLSARDEYGVILSIDGRGTATLHYPNSVNQSSKLLTGKKILLNKSYELDDAPDFERFFLITSKDELNVKSVLAAAMKLGMEKEKLKYNDIKLYDSENIKVRQVSIKINKRNQ